jgi:hypothetical protein
MTSDTISIAKISSPSDWRSLLWTIPLTALWTWLIYSVPLIPESGFAALAVRVFVHGLIALGLWIGLERTDLTPRQRRTTWLAIMIPFTLWATVAWTAAINGVFRIGPSALPLLPPAILLPMVIGVPLLLLSKRVGQLLDAMPATWLVALQIYRVFGAQWLAFWLRGVLPALWAVPAGTGDVLTGLFALPAVVALAAGTAEGRKAAILWNIFGIADFAVAITLGLLITPGPFQLIALDLSTAGLGDYPNVLTPAFVVPSSVLLHALSLRQLYRRGRTEAARR